MTTKQRVLEELSVNSDRYISGQDLADELFVTRAAVWKAINALKKDGIEIDAVTNKGYRLIPKIDPIDRQMLTQAITKIKRKYGIDYKLYIYDEISSTNDEALRLSRETGKNVLVVAGCQTNGRGRRGRSFFSPKGTGLYMSLAIHSSEDIAMMTQYTAIAAVAVALAIDKLIDKRRDRSEGDKAADKSIGDRAMDKSIGSKAIDNAGKKTGGDRIADNSCKSQIKWVNDIYLNGKKVTGILCEAMKNLEDSSDTCIVIGIGVNVFYPKDGFPKEIKNQAGAIINDISDYEGMSVRSELACTILNCLTESILEGDRLKLLKIYREKLCLTGAYVKINNFTDNLASDRQYAKVVGVSDDYRLQVVYDDGATDELYSGEVSVVRY